MKVYIATKLANTEQYDQVRSLLMDLGHQITYDWTMHGSVKETSSERLREVGQREEKGIREAELVIGLLTGGRGTHWELGFASGLNKPIILLGDPETHFAIGALTTTFYWVDGVMRVHDMISLRSAIQTVMRAL